MVNRVAAVSALLAFVLCLIVGGVEADNTFATTVERALEAMGATLIIGLVIGGMAKRMLEENVQSQAQTIKKNWANPPVDDR
jgi:hypothetical protein